MVACGRIGRRLWSWSQGLNGGFSGIPGGSPGGDDALLADLLSLREQDPHGSFFKSGRNQIEVLVRQPVIMHEFRK
jgi:hypothetical protein